MKIRNADFAKQYKWINPAIIEIRDDNSSTRAISSAGAKHRLQLFAKRLESDYKKFCDRSEVDIAETPDRFFELPEPTRVGDIANKDAQECAEALELIRDETVKYQSANYDFGFFIWDKPKQLGLIEAFKKLVNGLSTQDPLDMPRTTDNQEDSSNEG